MNPSQVTMEKASTTLPQIAIYVLGTFRLEAQGKPVPINPDSKAARLLLDLVVTHSHRLLRTQLLQHIWPHTDVELSNQCLHSLIHSLNKITRPALNGVHLVVHENGFYQLNCLEEVWIDLDEFKRQSAKGLQLLAQNVVPEGILLCQQALALYQGELYGDIDMQTLMEREWLRARFLELLVCLADHSVVEGHPKEALVYLHHLLAEDPCREDAHRQAMLCYLQLNQRTRALRQFRLCCQALALEFNAQPELATVTLFEQMCMGSLTL